MGRETGIPVVGPSTEELFAEPPRAWVLRALLECVDWHSRNEPASSNSILNACRSWRVAATGLWGSKAAGATWAAEQPDDFTVVQNAEKTRLNGFELDQTEAMEFLTFVREQIRMRLEAVEGP
jgi:hypothetical protein